MGVKTLHCQRYEDKQKQNNINGTIHKRKNINRRIMARFASIGEARQEH